WGALRQLKMSAKDLDFPDIGLTAAKDPTRLHWTDTVRHEATLAPVFGAMVAADVEAARTLGESDKAARELLAAQSTYQHRDAFPLTRYDRAIHVATEGQPLLDALRQFYEHPPVEGDPTPAGPAWEDIEADVATQVANFSPSAQVALAQCILG